MFQSSLLLYSDVNPCPVLVLKDSFGTKSKSLSLSSSLWVKSLSLSLQV